LIHFKPFFTSRKYEEKFDSISPILQYLGHAAFFKIICLEKKLSGQISEKCTGFKPEEGNNSEKGDKYRVFKYILLPPPFGP